MPYKRLLPLVVGVILILLGLLMTKDSAGHEEIKDKTYIGQPYVRQVVDPSWTPPPPPPPPPPTIASVKSYAYGKVAERGWNWSCFNTLVMKESGWKWTAQNPRSTAYGIGQFLNSTWALVGYRKTSDPYIQIDAMLVYVDVVRHGPCNALAFHNVYGYY